MYAWIRLVDGDTRVESPAAEQGEFRTAEGLLVSCRYRVSASMGGEVKNKAN